ncbi:hypothetical protein H5410_046517 [Solanum commersonii]|uniref:Uncharacterized protein n=1 Tax=Solanum commersonii TaxID=4109 RepID=A0A9J5XCG0_SOLCO|nr:hypothetical protein H5410_046517 [Solanum commersonii]
MNARNKTYFTHAQINCALKDSSCDSPISKNLMLTRFVSNASSSSIKVFKCPHTKDDSIFTQWFILSQDHKGLPRLVMGLSEKGFHFLQNHGQKGLSCIS